MGALIYLSNQMYSMETVFGYCKENTKIVQYIIRKITKPMITILNFGASPFKLLFYIVLGIFIAVVFVNVVASVLRLSIDYETNRLRKKRGL